LIRERGPRRPPRPLPRRAALEKQFQQVQEEYERLARNAQGEIIKNAKLVATTLAVALAWVRDRPQVVAPVVGARDTGQLNGSLRAEEITLPDEITAALDDISAIDVGYPERH
jgi:aryl-alcohol dehydrogenase-like predicted oxidoreductase